MSEEVAFIRKYLEMELLRFPDSFTTSVEIGPGAADALVPRLLLLPLVENALHHAFTGEEASAHLGIHASTRDGQLLLSVHDNGQGMPRGFASSRTAGLGIANTRQRLLACYGEDQAMDFTEGAGHRGTVVQLRMPLRLAPSQGAATEFRESHP